MKGKFISIWDGGQVVRTTANLDTRTGKITTEPVDADVEILDREYFESLEFFNSGEEFEICPECHEYILKLVIKEGNEALICSNSECENQ